MAVDTKWFQDRLSDKSLTQRKLAKMLDRDPASISLMLHGRRTLRAEEAAAMSRFLSVPVDELLRRAGVSASKAKHAAGVPIIGSIDKVGNVVIEHEPDGPDVQYAMPPDAQPSMVALICRPNDPSMATVDGWIAYYVPTAKVEPDLIGRLAVAKRAGGGVVLRQMRRGYMEGRYNLSPPFAEAKSAPEENVALDWAAPVIWLHP